MTHLRGASTQPGAKQHANSSYQDLKKFTTARSSHIYPAAVCVPKTRSERTGDGVRPEWDVTARCHCAELGDAQMRLWPAIGGFAFRYSSSRSCAVRAGGA